MLSRRILLSRLSATAFAAAIANPSLASNNAKAQQTVLIIRHGERPGGEDGVDVNGAPDPHSLTPVGWQRTGMWTELFAPSLGQPSVLPTPQPIFAAAPLTIAKIAAGRGGSKSRRPLETVTPLADKLGIKTDIRFATGGETALAAAVAQVSGVTLVCWEHHGIEVIAKALAPNTEGIPSHWPGDRFNVLFRFDRPDPASSWVFQQISPVMLKGDKPEPLVL